MFKNKFIYLCIIPSVVIIFSFFMKEAAGPYWLGVNSDPAYLYFVNSVYLLDNIVPYFTDHPGTTLELLGALVIGILTGWNNMVDQAFSDPERYLNALHGVMLFLYMSSFLGLTLYSYRKTKNIIFTLCIQLPALFFLTLKSYASSQYVLPVIVNINSDTLIMPITNLYVMLVIKLFYNKSSKPLLITSILFGMVCGLGVTTKLTFLPMLILPIILLPNWKAKGFFIGALLLTWASVLAPVFSRYKEIFSWIGSISVETSSSGDVVGIMKLTAYLNAMKGLFIDHWILTAIILIGIVICIKVVFVDKKKTHKNQHIKFLVVFIGVLIAQFILVSRHAGPHYMSPAYGLLGLVLGWIYLINRNRDRHLFFKNKKLKIGVCPYLLILVVLGIGQSTYAWGYYKNLKKTNQAVYNFSQKIYTEYAQKCVVFGFYRSSSLPMAIRFAQGHGNFKYYSKLLKEKYPDALFFNAWHRVFHHFDKNVMLKQVIPESGCALLYGSAADFQGSDYLDVEIIEQVYNEKLYRIKSSTLDKAHRFYLIAKALESQGKYKQAYILALQSHQFGRPGADEYAERLKKKIDF